MVRSYILLALVFIYFAAENYTVHPVYLEVLM